MELRVLVLPSDVFPHERRIKVAAQDVEALRKQVLGKLKLPVEAGLAVYEVRGQETRPVRTLDQLEDKSKLKVLRSSTSDAEDRRARMKSAFSLISEGAGVSGVASTPPTESLAANGAQGGEDDRGDEDDEDGEDVPGTTFIRYYNVDGVPYYYDRVTGETQWDEPQVQSASSSPLASAPAAEVSDVSDAGQTAAPTAFITGQAVQVKGRHTEVWEVVRVDCDRIQVKLRGESIRKTFDSNQLSIAEICTSTQRAAEGDTDSAPQRAHEPAPELGPAVVKSSTGTQKLRVFILEAIDSKNAGEPAGFVMVSSCASLVDVREEIKEDELEVPEFFSFVVDGDLVKSAQEKKVHVEHFVPQGHVYIVPDGEKVVDATGQPKGGSASDRFPPESPDTRSISGGDNKLPVLVGHLSKCGQMPFSAWQQRYFRLSNGTLSYFVAPDDKVAKGSIVIDETCTVLCAGEKYKKKFCFEVSSWKSQLALCAECEEDCELWKAHIKLTVNVVKALAAERGIMRGLVDKRDSGFMKKWRAKWAVVNRTTLCFYDSPDDPARQRPPSDEFELLGATVDVAPSSGDRHYCFSVVPSQLEPIELSTRHKDDLEEWVRMLRRNIEGTAVSVVPTAGPAWGVQNSAVVEKHVRAGSSGWFDVEGLDPDISVIASRQRRIDGEKTSEYYIRITHSCASMSWHISRKLQDILDLHEAISNTDPTKHEYLDKFIQLPREKRTKSLTSTELEQHCKLVQVYAEEALKQAGSVEYSALRSFFCPTDKGFDQHRGRLSIQRRACAPFPAQSCWCELRTSDHTFSWCLDEHAKDGIRVSLRDSVLITQKKLFPSPTTGFELILPERGIRLLASSDEPYAAVQWIECLKTQVSHVLSDDEGSSLLTGSGMFVVEATPLEPIPWLGAQTPDHTGMNINTLCSPAAYPGTGASVRITDPQLLARLHAHKHGRLDADDSADDHDDDFDDEQQDHGNDGDAYESGEDDSDEFNEYPMGGNRRLSATMDTSDVLFRSNRQWNDGVAVVLDTGSYAVKAGLGCDSFPSVVERSYDSATGAPLVYREQITTNWDAVTSMWDEIFHHKMGICPADHNFVLTEAPDMTRVSKQTMAEIMFEYFNVPAITIQSAGVLALYAQGIWTGVVVDCGNRTKITPVYEGTVIPHAVMQSCFGGVDVDNALTSMLVEKHGATYNRDTSSLDMQSFKEQHAFVARDSAAGMRAGASAAAIDADIVVKYRMRSGTNLLFDRERYLCGEELFTASLPNGCKGLAQGVQWSVQKCESVLRKQLFGSILLCGGTTCMNGFPERLRHDIGALLQSRVRDDGVTSDIPKVDVIAPRNRKYTAWLGGASLAQMDDFGDRILVSADEYDERGAAAF